MEEKKEGDFKKWCKKNYDKLMAVAMALVVFCLGLCTGITITSQSYVVPRKFGEHRVRHECEYHRDKKFNRDSHNKEEFDEKIEESQKNTLDKPQE